MINRPGGNRQRPRRDEPPTPLIASGSWAQLPIDRINFRNMRAVSCVCNRSVETDGCGGQVKIQSFATYGLRTENGNDTRTVYGEPKDL